VAQVEASISRIPILQFLNPPRHIFNPFDADKRQRSVKHHAHRLSDRLSDDLRPVDLGTYPDRIVEKSLRCKSPTGEAGVLEILRLHPDNLFENRVAHEEFFCNPSVNNEVMGIELETHFSREIGEPVDRCLQPNTLSVIHQSAKFRESSLRVRVSPRLEPNPEILCCPPDDRSRKHAVRDDRHIGDFDEREIGEGETAGDAENHRLGEIEASVIEKRGDHTALTMGVLLVFEGLGFRHSLFPGKVFQPLDAHAEEARVFG